MLSCLIYVTLTVLIPGRQTYLALKRGSGEPSVWSHYWAYFALLHLISYLIPSLTS